MTRFSFLVAAATLTGLAACSGTGTTDPNQINALIAAADGNTAIVARDTGFTGSAPRIFVSMDGAQVAALGNNEVASFQATPGPHLLSLRFEGIDIGLETNTLSFSNDPNRTQFFVVSLKQKFVGAEMKITEVSADSFRGIVN